NLQKKWLQANYDYVIFDTRPGYTVELINSILVADMAILLTRLDADTVEKTIDMYDRIYAQFKNKYIFLVQNQVPTPVEGLSDATLDLDIEEKMKAWAKFVEDKDLVTIPLKNEIAYMLSKSKIIPFDSLLMTYIQQIAALIMKSGL
ncbi:MAG: hypothetical protein ACFFBD_08820, partial [Candidatus Hodarchaeota archaeon]